MNEFTPDFLIIPYKLIADDELTSLNHTVYGILYWYERLKDGKCTASNGEIARVARATEGAVANCLTRLEKRGYIHRKFFEDGNRQEITTLVHFSQGGGSSMDEGGVHQPMNRESKRVESNTTLTSEDKLNNAVKDAIHLYQSLYKHHFGSLPSLPSYGSTHTLFKRLLTRYSFAQVGCLIFLHFEWRGMTGEADSMYQKAYDAGFPIAWLANNAPQYETFLMAQPDTKAIWSQEHDKQLVEYLDTLVEQLLNDDNVLPF